MNREKQITPTPPLGRVGVIGDVHAQNAALSLALDFLRGLPDLSGILCSGDLVTGDGDANEAIFLLRDAGVPTVRGNHDRWFGQDYYLGLKDATVFYAVEEENRTFLSQLPVTQTFDTVSGSLLLCHVCHGVGDDDMAGVYPGGPDDEIAWMLQKKELSDFRYLIAGHTHERMVRPLLYPNGDVLTVINAGTLLPHKKPGFLVCDFAAQTATVYHITLPDTVSEGQTVSLRPTSKGL